MRMLTVTTDFLPNGGGLARYADALARVFGDQMCVVADVSASEQARQEIVQSAPYHLEYRSLTRSCWPRWWPMVGVIRSHDADVICVHQVLPCGVAARLAGKPYIVCLHGTDFERASRHVWKRVLMRWVLRGADTIVANSKALATRVLALTGREALVCYPQPWIVGNPGEHHACDDHRVEFISVSRLVERKGFQRVLAILRDHPDLATRVHYTIAGAGEYASTLNAMITEHRLESCVTLLETQDEATLRDVYARGDVFVLPTVQLQGDIEGFGIVYLEAATFGVPSIASRIEGVSEAVIHQETGILVDNDEKLSAAMRLMVEDANARQRLGEHARARSALFTAQQQFAPLLARYGLQRSLH